MNVIHRPTSADNYSLLLKKIADELLSRQAEDNGLNAAARLYSLCSSVTGVDEYSAHAGDSDGSRLSSGEAISPGDAARCVLDYSRTSKFLKGLYAAILEARKRFTDAAIEILYAGCGPFAPLAIPLTTRFNSAEIKFTLLDIHKRSLDAARRIFEALGKSAFVRVRVNLGRVLELTAGSCHNLLADSNSVEHGESSLVSQLLNVSEDVDGEFYLMLSTAIDVFDEITLDDYESGLTCPRILYDVGKAHAGQLIEFEYHLGDKPGFRYRSL